MKDSRAVSPLIAWGTALCLAVGVLPLPAAEPVVGALRLEPAAVNLTTPRHSHSILVSGNTAAGLSLDLTASASFISADSKIATVDANGWIKPVASGKTTITIKA